MPIRDVIHITCKGEVHPSAIPLTYLGSGRVGILLGPDNKPYEAGIQKDKLTQLSEEISLEHFLVTLYSNIDNLNNKNPNNRNGRKTLAEIDSVFLLHVWDLKYSSDAVYGEIELGVYIPLQDMKTRLREDSAQYIQFGELTGFVPVYKDRLLVLKDVCFGRALFRGCYGNEIFKRDAAGKIILLREYQYDELAKPIEEKILHVMALKCPHLM